MLVRIPLGLPLASALSRHLSVRLGLCIGIQQPPQSTTRHLSTTCQHNQSHLDTLRRNPELSLRDAQNELRWLAAEACARHGGDPGAAEAMLMDMVVRRSSGEPLQYILGYLTLAGNTDFGPITLLTRPPILIPREETAHITSHLASQILTAYDSGRISRPIRILDLCTGSACIPLLLSHILGDKLVEVIGIDINPAAIALAKDNISLLSDSRVRVFQADLFAQDFVPTLRRETNGPIDLITANPPYVTASEYASLPPSVRDHEDERALVAGPVLGVADGVAFYQRISRLAGEILLPDPEIDSAIPRIAVEIGAEQGDPVSRLLPGKTEVVEDQYGLARMVMARFA